MLGANNRDIHFTLQKCHTDNDIKILPCYFRIICD